jgi:hypothetical protein
LTSVEGLTVFYAALKLLVISILRKTKRDMTCIAAFNTVVDEGEKSSNQSLLKAIIARCFDLNLLFLIVHFLIPTLLARCTSVLKVACHRNSKKAKERHDLHCSL